MLRIMEAMTRCSAQVAETVIAQVLDKQNNKFFSQQEIETFEWVSQVIKTTGNIPSLSLFLDRFPENSIPFKSVVPLNDSDVNQYFQLVLRKRRNQVTAQTLMKASQEVLENGFTPSVAEKLSEITIVSDTDQEVSHTNSAEAFLSYYNAKKDKPAGISVGIPAVDKAIGHLPFGGLSVLAGFVANGKSLLGNNIMYRAKMDKWNCAIISLEVPKEDLLVNLLSKHSQDIKFGGGLNAQDIKFCRLNEEQQDKLREVTEDYFNTGGQIVLLDETDFGSLSFPEIQSKLIEVDDQLKKETGYGLDCLMVDHIGLLAYGKSSKGDSDMQVINSYVSFFRKLAIGFRRNEDGTYKQIHVLLLAQINREGWKRASKQDGLYDLRALSTANELERSAQIIMTIFVDEQLKLAKTARICLLKNRFGETLADPVDVVFHPEKYTCAGEDPGLEMATESDLDFDGLDDFEL